MQELAVIFVVALLIFGPKRLPELARTLGKGLAEFRRASNELRQSFMLDANPAPKRTEPDPRESREPIGQPDQLVDAPTPNAAEQIAREVAVEPDAGTRAKIDESGHGDLADDETDQDTSQVADRETDGRRRD